MGSVGRVGQCGGQQPSSTGNDQEHARNTLGAHQAAQHKPQAVLERRRRHGLVVFLREQGDVSSLLSHALSVRFFPCSQCFHGVPRVFNTSARRLPGEPTLAPSAWRRRL